MVVRLGRAIKFVKPRQGIGQSDAERVKDFGAEWQSFSTKPVASHVFNTRHIPWHYPLHLAVSELC